MAEQCGSDLIGKGETEKITQSAFKTIGDNLEVRYRKFEDISRYSRDITWESKKTISTILGYFDDVSVLERAEKKLKWILTSDKCFRGLALALHNQDRWMFLRAYSPGIQEFIEALALYTFFKERRLLSYEELLDKLTFELPVSQTSIKSDNVTTDETDDKEQEVPCAEGKGKPDRGDKAASKTAVESTGKFAILLPKTDFFLGLSDVTGELMRACASGVQTAHFRSFLFDSCSLVRILYQSLSCISPFPRGMSCKIGTMRSNLSKMELACYNFFMDRHISSINFRIVKHIPQAAEYSEVEDSGYE